MAVTMNFGFSRNFRASVASCGVPYAGTEELKARAAVHCPFQQLEAIDLSLHGAGGPRQRKRRVDGVDVATEPPQQTSRTLCWR